MPVSTHLGLVLNDQIHTPLALRSPLPRINSKLTEPGGALGWVLSSAL